MEPRFAAYLYKTPTTAALYSSSALIVDSSGFLLLPPCCPARRFHEPRLPVVPSRNLKLKQKVPFNSAVFDPGPLFSFAFILSFSFFFFFYFGFWFWAPCHCFFLAVEECGSACRLARRSLSLFFAKMRLLGWLPFCKIG